MRVFILVLATLLTAGSFAHTAAESVALTDAINRPTVRVELKGTGRAELSMTVSNSATTPLEVDVPAGTVFAATDGARVVSLRAAKINSPAAGSVVATVPCAALSASSDTNPRSFQLCAEREADLDPFLKSIADRNDLPRNTAQLAILAIRENITFGAFVHEFVPIDPADPGAAATAVVQGIDALGLLQTAYPGREFALAKDNELKLKALRNPVCRAKAMQVFGMALPGEVGGVAPDIGQLLHTKAGDNCPICRMRQQAERGASDL